MNIENDDYCLACGSRNPQGFKLRWRVENEQFLAEFTPQKVHQGWKDIAHGGIVAALLDEAMGLLSYRVLGKALTAEMIIRYSAPAAVGKTLLVRARLEKGKGKLILAQAEIQEKESAKTIATGTGKLIRVGEPRPQSAKSA